MKTDGLSINLATVRQQWDMRQARRGLPAARDTAIAPWREQIGGDGLVESARCRATAFGSPAGAAGNVPGRRRGGPPGRDRRQPRSIEEAAALGADCLVVVGGGLPKGSQDIARRARNGGRGHAAVLPHARAAACRSRSSRCIRCMRPTALHEHVRRRSICAMRSATASASRSTSITSGGTRSLPTQIARAGRQRILGITSATGWCRPRTCCSTAA